MKIGIIGAGHSGVAAAQALSKAGVETVLFSNEKHLPYFRPRIPSVAFGQAEKEDAIMHPEDWYNKNNIKLQLNTEITSVDKNCEVHTSKGEKFSFDKLLLTYGAEPVLPPFAKNLSADKVIPLWDMDNALMIKNKIDKAKYLVIIGGGVIGLEAAIRAVDAGFSVKVIERADTLLVRNLNPITSTALSKYLKDKKVEVLTGVSVEKLEEAKDKVLIHSDKLKVFETDIVIMSIGAGINCSLLQSAELKHTRKLSVDEHLQSNINSIYGAGDITEVLDIPSVCSALRAAKQGKVAALNLIAEKPENTFTESPVTLQVKFNDFSLFAIGNPSETHKEIILEDDTDNNILRIVNVNDDNKVIGVQMLGSNKGFKKYEKLYLTGGCYDEL